MLNPCCCISPRIGTFVFAIVDLILAGSYFYDVIRVVLDDHISNSTNLWCELVIASILLFLALLLLCGAVQNSAENLRIWLIIWVIFILVAVLFQIYNAISSRGGDKEPFNRVWISFPVFLLFLYQVWVVYAYLEELRHGTSGLTYFPRQVA